MKELNRGKVILKLDRLMGEQNISINKLACRAEMQRTQLKSYMHNDVQRVDLDILARLCHVLECNISDLLEYSPDDKKISS